MGLWVRVLKNLKPADSDDCYYLHPPIPEWKDRMPDIREGYYEADETISRIDYAYSTHNRFREQLMRVIDNHKVLDKDGEINFDELTPDTPFFKLVNFSDCEGCISWSVAEELYNDFVKWSDKAHKILDPYYLSLYNQWKNLTHDAKDNGVIYFC